jgi:hypothetical protein
VRFPIGFCSTSSGSLDVWSKNERSKTWSGPSSKHQPGSSLLPIYSLSACDPRRSVYLKTRLFRAQKIEIRIKGAKVHQWLIESQTFCTRSLLQLKMSVEIEFFSHREVGSEVIAIVPKARYQACSTRRCADVKGREMEMDLTIVCRKLVTEELFRKTHQ